MDAEEHWRAVLTQILAELQRLKLVTCLRQACVDIISVVLHDELESAEDILDWPPA